MQRRAVFQLSLAMCLLAAALWLAGAQSSVSSARALRLATAAATPPAVSSFDKAPVLTPDKPVTDTLDDKIALRSYKFSAKAGESYRVAVNVQSGNIWTSLSVVSADLVQVLGESDGEALIDSTLHVAIPTDGTYGVIVAYLSPNFGTPSPGTFMISLTRIP